MCKTKIKCVHKLFCHKESVSVTLLRRTSPKLQQLLQILSGRVDSRQDSGSVRTNLQVSFGDSLSVSLQRFWDQEELLIPSPVLDAGERECVRIISLGHILAIMKDDILFFFRSRNP